MYYSGIGSRETPNDALEIMKWLAFELFEKGYILRSGGAQGADQAFEIGLANAECNKTKIQNAAEIYLPWDNFEEATRTWINPIRKEPQEEAYEIAANFHPAWGRLSFGAKKLHARNVHQIFGYDVTQPYFSEFVICWTKNAKGGGGTGQAIRIAKEFDVPVYDLANEESLLKITDRIIEDG